MTGVTDGTNNVDDSGNASGTDDKRSTAVRFDERATAYLESAVHREGADLDRLASWCGSATCALDVATGAGHAAGALREAGVDRVLATDAAPEMVATAERTYDVEGVIGDAERLPFAADTFDAATCRIAAHHFPDPAAFVAEVGRVLVPGGTFAFEDNVAPADPDLDAFLNGVERLRDPTHVRSHTVATWLAWLEDAGFTVEETRLVKRALDYEAWVAKPDQPAENRARLRERFADPPPGAVDAFDISYEDVDGPDGDGRPRAPASFANLKLLVRAVR